MALSRVGRALARLDVRGVRYWGPGYVIDRMGREEPDPTRPIQLHVCVADHFEPSHLRPGLGEERRRIETWVRRYPLLAQRHRDHRGRVPVRTLFYPLEEYRAAHLDALASLCRQGYADVEVHLHHHNDTAQHLRRSLLEFAHTLHEQHGLLRRNPATGQIEYAFIHGDWALDNSHPDRIFCGVDNELSILVETGCYADLTLPSAPSPTQTRVVNSVYYAAGRAGRSKGHDVGPQVCVGGTPPVGEPLSLLMIQGPLAPNLRSRRFGVLPRLETGELSPDNRVDPALRIPLWVQHAPMVRGAPNHRFIKLHAHGLQAGGEAYFLEPGGGFDRLLDVFERDYNDGRRYTLHYVTAREMYETIKGLESGTIAP